MGIGAAVLMFLLLAIYAVFVVIFGLVNLVKSQMKGGSPWDFTNKKATQCSICGKVYKDGDQVDCGCPPEELVEVK